MVISNNSFLKFHGKMIWEHQHDHVKPNLMHYNKVCYKETAQYVLYYQYMEQQG